MMEYDYMYTWHSAGYSDSFIDQLFKDLELI